MTEVWQQLRQAPGETALTQTMNTNEASLAAASDPATPVEDLLSLSINKDPGVLQALARNPNVPEELLQELWQRFPESILENPLLTLWEFTNAGSAAKKLGDRAMLALYNHLRDTGAELPEDLFTPKTLAYLARRGMHHFDGAVFKHFPHEKDPAVRVRMVENPRNGELQDIYQRYAPDEIWELFATDPHPEVRLHFSVLLRSVSEKKPPERLDIYSTAARHLAKDGRPEVDKHLAHCKWIPADLVERLSKSPDACIREALSGCAFAPPHVVARLAKDSSTEVRIAVARRSQAPEIHAILRRDRSPEVRRELAQNASLSREVLDLFSLGDKPSVVEAVFLHPKADTSLRTKILLEASPEVHRVLASMGKSLTLSFYRTVKHVVSAVALENLAGAPGLRREIVEDLARDKHPEVRLAVAQRITNRHNNSPHEKNIALVNAFGCDPDPRIRERVCTDWRLNKGATAVFFSDPDPIVRKKALCAVLGSLVGCRDNRRLHPYRDIYNAKASLVAKLARDPDELVRQEIATCPEAPPRALGILLDDPEPYIRNAVLEHTRWPYGVMIDFVKRFGPRIDSVSVYHGDTTPSVPALRLLARSRNPFVRFLVARCGRTPRRTLRELAEDRHPSVRQTALRQLEK